MARLEAMPLTSKVDPWRFEICCWQRILILQRFPSLVLLSSTSALTSLSQGSLLKKDMKHPQGFHIILTVKRFYLPDILLVESYKISYAFCLMRSFPYLEYLEIMVYIQDEYDSDYEESVELECLDVTLDYLREV